MNTYYKVIVIKCDPFESEIIDERNFKERLEASAYASKSRNPGTIAVVVELQLQVGALADMDGSCAHGVPAREPSRLEKLYRQFCNVIVPYTITLERG